MSIITRMRKQKAVWWKRLTANEFGTFAYDPPVEIDCRWDDETVEYRDTKEQLHVSEATVYVDRVIAIGDILSRGELESATPDDPTEVEKSYEVGLYQEIPNLKATETLRVARLVNRMQRRA